ncbi:RNA polymerase sigma factor [Isosphaeraceae bacterium EP7]
MASLGGGSVLGRVQRLFGHGTVAGLGERELLDRFVAARDEGAFEALLDRFGPMVMGVCRRALDDPHDVDDAFQATFLVLVVRARTIRDGDRLGPWLHGVATKVASRARIQGRQRRRREAGDAEGLMGEVPVEVERSELRAVLDEELERLPESYRQPIILCYLQGQTHDEAAARLRWPVGTVRSRMARGRDLLRGRLERRGMALSTAALFLETEVGPATASAALIRATLEAAMRVAAGKTIAAGMVSAAVLTLAQGVTTTMTMSTFTWTAGIVLALGLAGGGIGVAALQDNAGAQVPGDEPSVEELKTQLHEARQELADSHRREAELARSVETLQGRLDTASTRTRTQPKAGAATGKTRGLATAPGGEQNDQDLETAQASRGTPKDEAKPGRGQARNSREGMPGMGMQAMMRMTGRQQGIPGGEQNNQDLESEQVSEDTPKDEAKAGSGMRGMMMGRQPGMTMGGAMRGMPGGMGMMGGEGMSMPGMGMMGMMGGGGMSMSGKPPGYVSGGSIFTMVKPRDGKFWAYSLESGVWDAYTLPPGVSKVVPVVDGKVAMLMMEGPRITQVAAFSGQSGKWIPQDLREPATKVTPIVVGGLNAVYIVGRFVYAFGVEASAWGVLELEEGAKPGPMIGRDSVTLEHGGKLHIFSGKLAKWSSIEIKAPD